MSCLIPRVFVTLCYNFHFAYGKVRIRRKAQKGAQKERAVRAETELEGVYGHGGGYSELPDGQDSAQA